MFKNTGVMTGKSLLCINISLYLQLLSYLAYLTDDTTVDTI